MVNLKKLILAPCVIVSFFILIYLLAPLFKSYDFIFSLSLDTFINLISIAALTCVASLLFTLLATIAQDWKISLPVIIIGSVMPFILIDFSLAIVLAAGIFLSLLLSNLNLDVALKSYLNFQPSSLLGPPIRHLSGFLILAICITYFFSTSNIIAQSGFQIPDSIIDMALQLNLNPTASDSLTGLQESIQLPAKKAHDFLKQTIKEQVQNFILPYQNLIPAVLAVLLFLTLQSLASMINLLIYPSLWLTFLILEKTGFVKFELEQRPVRKMVV